jgi:hypothetical protein
MSADMAATTPTRERLLVSRQQQAWSHIGGRRGSVVHSQHNSFRQSFLTLDVRKNATLRRSKHIASTNRRLNKADRRTGRMGPFSPTL